MTSKVIMSKVKSRLTTRFVYRCLMSFSAVVLLSLISIVWGWRSPATAQIPIEDTEFLPSSHPTAVLSSFPVRFEAHIPPRLTMSDDPAGDAGRGVINQDNREPVTSEDYPWSAVGRVVGKSASGSNYICTGTLIADDVVLTNAHCVVSPETHEPSQMVQFQPNLVNGFLVDESHVADAVKIFPGTDFREDNTPPTADDWAFLKLDQSLGEIYGTIGVSELSVSELANDYRSKLAMVGYSGDFPAGHPGNTAGVHKGCTVLGEVDDSLIHDCDSYGGSSGGPILTIVDDKVQIVGVNSAGRTESFTSSDGEQEETGLVNYATKISRVLEAIESDDW